MAIATRRLGSFMFTLEENPLPRLAMNITGAELLSRPLARDLITIPTLLHQSWKTNVLPAKFEHWSASCRSRHPDWEWVLWTDEDNLNLVRKYYPWLEESYRALPAEIYRADLVRSLYMYTFGGVYLDLDMECLRPSEELFKKYVPSGSPPLQTALFGRMGDHPDFEHSIPNAWMASPPGNPAVLILPEMVDRRVRDGEVPGSAEYLTGPVALRDSLIEYERRKITRGNGLGDSIAKIQTGVPFPNNNHNSSEIVDHQVILLPSELIYPNSWSDGAYTDVCFVFKDTYNAELCKSALEVAKKGSVYITYWSHTHGPGGEQNMEHIT
ncbi:hypothetical protein JCM24511_10154 [Saitozyma sp. JCM 24511]|nr:hypothetical protein JCM24511_10154 [Saitozyma sp. JCM 24511]